LAAAGDYLRKTAIGVDEYLVQYEQRWHEHHEDAEELGEYGNSAMEESIRESQQGVNATTQSELNDSTRYGDTSSQNVTALSPEDNERGNAPNIATDTNIPYGMNDRIKGKQNAQIDDISRIQAGPPTDSGYASTRQGKSEHARSLEVEHWRQRTEEVQSRPSTDEAYPSSRNEPSEYEQDLNDSESDDIRTIYSDASSLPPLEKESYISELADGLFSTVHSLQPGVQIMDRISRALPELLKAFAFRIGHNAPTQMHRDVMVFVHKNRR
jgi:hypothetical protein